MSPIQKETRPESERTDSPENLKQVANQTKNQAVRIDDSMPSYKCSAKELLENLKVDPKKGLNQQDVDTRRERYGLNRLEEASTEPLYKKFLRQFQDFLVLILIVAAIFSAVTGDWIESILILAIVIVNAILGVIQEGKAEKAVEALQKMASPHARVLRDGRQAQILSEELVPGDIVILEAGDVVPADLRLLEATNMSAEEAALTGESVPVEKKAEDLGTDDLPLGDRSNMLYGSTALTAGRGTAVVVDTGSRTEVGKIADQLQTIQSENTPLQESISHLGKMLGIILMVVVVVTFFVGLLQGGELVSLLMTSISLAVAAVPEGLPAIVTIVLSIGMGRMADRHAIVKRLLAVETLGSVDVICSDKTGTLTQNEMTVTKIYAGGKLYDVTGTGYQPEGVVYESSSKEHISYASIPEPVERLMMIGALCNEAVLTEEDGVWDIIGDPTEGSLLTMSAKLGFERDDLMRKYPRLGDKPFDSRRKMMSVFHEGVGDDPVSLTKGAPDILLKKCRWELTSEGVKPLSDARRASILQTNRDFAQKALRVLAFAYKNHEDGDFEAAESDMVFVGLAGMIDPARPEVKKSIALCHQAGIRTVMITGDYSDTAVAIAKELNMMKDGDMVLSGSDLDEMDDTELEKVVEHVVVFARVSPEHKVRIVNALRSTGHIAAMTGDGVNDAPALKRADIGVAMGITGTEVAKGAADMILTDDNFSTIVDAVYEGRIIYDNIRKFINFLLSCNIGEVLVIFCSMLFLGPEMIPLVPIQLLWLNLVTDSFPALALGKEEGEADIMERPPRKKDAKILDRNMTWSIITQAVAIFAAVYTAFNLGLARYGLEGNMPHDGARSYAFVTLIMAELIRAYSARSERDTIFELGFFSNRTMIRATGFSFILLVLVMYIPALDPIFHTVPLRLTEWLLLIGLSLIPFIVGELYKMITREKRVESKAVN